jgi:hypothetical protein
LEVVSGEVQRWDGGRDRVLPEGAIVNHLDFLEALLDAGLPGVAGEDIVEVLKNGAIMRPAAGEVACDEQTGYGLVVLWLAYFRDQRMYVRAGERVEHEEITPLERWHDAETAIGALSVGFPTRPIEFGFLVGERATALPWFEFCRSYEYAPQYVLASWE